MNSQSQKFWNFSISLYARERVADACLDLQDSYGIDVNLLLYCYWYGTRFGDLPETTLQRALALSATWRNQVVQPLRNVRRWMKTEGGEFAGLEPAQFAALRDRIKSDELAAEKYQQELLEEIALSNLENAEEPQDESAIARNLERYLAALKLETNALIASQLNSISKAL